GRTRCVRGENVAQRCVRCNGCYTAVPFHQINDGAGPRSTSNSRRLTDANLVFESLPKTYNGCDLSSFRPRRAEREGGLSHQTNKRGDAAEPPGGITAKFSGA